MPLVGARGLLSAEQSRVVLGKALTTGSAVRLLQAGPATDEATFAAIAAARDHVNLETYILDATRSVSASPTR